MEDIPYKPLVRVPRKRIIQTVSKVRQAIKRGELTRQPCEVCGSDIWVHAHHDDYDKPLQVRWLCVRHHVHAHVPHTARRPKSSAAYDWLIVKVPDTDNPLKSRTREQKAAP